MADNSSHPLETKNILIVLVKHGLITKDQAREILFKSDSLKRRLEADERRRLKEKGVDRPLPIGSVTILDVLTKKSLHRMGDTFKGLEEEILYKTLSTEWGFPYKTIDPLKLDLNLVTSTIPLSFARKHLVLPVSKQNQILTLATVNPFNQEVFNDISRATQMTVQPVVSAKSDIVKTIDEFFGFKRSIAEAESNINAPTVDLGNLEQYVKIKSAEELPANDQHIINAVNHLFSYALDQRASDIHIEPKRDISMIRMRIDGILHDIYRLPKNVHPAIISRIKNLSRLDMAEKRRPQDGRIKTGNEDMEVEIRISTVPVAFGEKAVMRIMDPEVLFQDLEYLGFEPPDLIRYNQLVKNPHGIILDCGPTGSGKSTTLYSTLRDLSSPEINITTVEDPIEMVEESFNQIAVQPALDITFATILRNILRQDPDVIMIGEMRDLETAQNAIQAALTGHLVFSTLHTNDSVSAITRLIDLGVPAFLIQNTMVGIISQRLLRKICPYCTEIFQMPKAELREVGIELPGDDDIELKRGKGCHKCRGTGYYGRIAVFELLPYTLSIRRLTTPETDQVAVLDAAIKEGMVPLRENAIKKMLSGTTTYHEVLRVT
jgi:general secretion pathway protein E